MRTLEPVLELRDIYNSEKRRHATVIRIKTDDSIREQKDRHSRLLFGVAFEKARGAVRARPKPVQPASRIEDLPRSARRGVHRLLDEKSETDAPPAHDG